jgi:hypothetical protein
VPDAPTKAYYVERVSRCVVVSLVFADSIEDAKRRSIMEGETIDTRYEARGFGRAWRAPEEDREPDEAELDNSG